MSDTKPRESTVERFDKYVDTIKDLDVPNEPYVNMTKTEIFTFINSETSRLQNLLSVVHGICIRIEQAINEGDPIDEVLEWVDAIKENTKEFINE